MPHNHIFMQQQAADEQLVKTTTGYQVDRLTSIEDYVATLVRAAFQKHADEVLRHDQVVRYPMRITNSMPVDMSVNITAWYTPKRAPYFEFIRLEVHSQLMAWQPSLGIEVHMVVVGQPGADKSSPQDWVNVVANLDAEAVLRSLRDE